MGWRRVMGLWLFLTGALIVLQFFGTQWAGGLEPVERCSTVGTSHPSLAGVRDATQERWPPGTRCHIKECPWREHGTAIAPDCRGNRERHLSVVIAASFEDWAWLGISSAVGAGLLAGLGILGTRLARRHRSADRRSTLPA